MKTIIVGCNIMDILNREEGRYAFDPSCGVGSFECYEP